MEANVRQAIGAMRAAVLLPRVVGLPPVAVGHPAAAEEPPVVVVVAVVAVAGVEDVGNQEIEK